MLLFTDTTFQSEVLDSSVLTFVDFWAPWCGPCQMMGPIAEALGDEYDASKLKIGKLNVDENPVTAGHYRVMSIPTFLLFKDGKQVDQLVGGVPKEKLKAFIEKHL